MEEKDLLSVPTVFLGFLSLLSCIYVCLSAMESGYMPCRRWRKRCKRKKKKEKEQLLNKSNPNIHGSTIAIHGHYATSPARPGQLPEKKKETSSESDSSGGKRRVNGESSIGMVDIIFWMSLVDGLHEIPEIVNWFPQAFHMSFFYGNKVCIGIGLLAQFCAVQSPMWHILLAYHLAYLLSGKHGVLELLTSQRNYHYFLVNIIPFIGTLLPLIFGEYGEYIDNTKYGPQKL